MVFVTVEGVDGFDDGILQVFDSFEVVVVDGRVFEMAPETLDQVEIRSIRSVPDDRESIPVGLEERLHGLGVMDGTVVQEEVNVFPIGIDVLQKPVQEIEELGTAFPVGDQRGHFAGHRVQRTEDRHATVLACRRDLHPLATLVPAARQAGIQVELGFVDIRESTTTGAGLRFFKADFFWRLARATALGSWRCLRSSLGRP